MPFSRSKSAPSIGTRRSRRCRSWIAMSSDGGPAEIVGSPVVATGRPAGGAVRLKPDPTDVPDPTNVDPGVDPGVAPGAVTGVDPGVAITVTGSGGPLSRSHQPASTPAANTAASTGRMRARWLSF